MAMTDGELDRELAALGLDREWVTLGVLNDEWLGPRGRLRQALAENERELAANGGEQSAAKEFFEEELRFALYCYLDNRSSLDDATFAALLRLASRDDPSSGVALADWEHLTLAQLARVADADISAASRKLAAQKLRLRTLGAPSDGPVVDVVGLVEGGRGVDPAFHVRGFKFTVAWRRRLSATELHRVGALLSRIPAGEQSRCHLPAFGLHLDAGTDDEMRVSICFRCNNTFLDGGGSWRFDGQSPPALELLAYFKVLSPADWRARFA